MSAHANSRPAWDPAARGTTRRTHFVVMARADDEMDDRKLADFTDRGRAEIFANGYAAALDHQLVGGVRVVIEEVV